MNKIEELLNQLCPNGVKRASLGSLGEFYGGLSGKSKDDFEDGNAKFISYMNVFSNPSLQIDVPDRVKISEGERQNTIQYGDILFTGSSETPDECGMSSVLTAKTEELLYLNSFSFGFRFNDLSEIDPHYCKHLFRSARIREMIAKTANGVTRFNVSKKLFAKIEIPIPPLPVQKEIVRILDSMTDLQQNLQQELDARKKQYEAYRSKLLSFNDIVGGVTQSKLGSKCQFQNGYAFKSALFKDKGAAIIRITNIFNGIVDISDVKYFDLQDYKVNLRQFTTKKGDILIAMSGATTGKIGVIQEEEPYYINQRVGLFRPIEGKLDNRFLFHYLSSKASELYFMAGGGAQPNLSSKDIMEKLYIPDCSIDKQKDIAEVLDSLVEMISNIQDEIRLRDKQYKYYREQLLSF